MRVDQTSAYSEFLDIFHPGRNLVPFKEPPPPAIPDASKNTSIMAVEDAKSTETTNSDLIPILDVRSATPRQISELGQDFYAAGVLEWREYEMLAFQPELQPNYNSTIGALTGEKANPERPRDFIAIWEDRLSFERKYNPSDQDLVNRTHHIVETLRRIESPTNLVI